MFGFSLATQLFQGSAQRTWNCVTQFTNLLWYKFNHIRHPIMPRSRRRHHSRSRSRSRSHSHDRDRDVKRRKIDSVESPAHKRSVSCEPQIPSTTKKDHEDDVNTVEFENSSSEVDVKNDLGQESHKIKTDIEEKLISKKEQLEVEGSFDMVSDFTNANEDVMKVKAENDESSKEQKKSETGKQTTVTEECSKIDVKEQTTVEESEMIVDDKSPESRLETTKSEELESSTEEPQLTLKVEGTPKRTAETSTKDESISICEGDKQSTKQLEEKLLITPKKAMSPKQLQKKLDSEQKRKQKQLEREERERKKQEEKERVRLEKQKQKQEKEEQKQKEREMKEEQKRKEREEKEEQKRKEREEKEEQKRKEQEEKEAKRKEKEEREEQKRKEREQEKLRRQQEIEEKNKEKQKQEEQKRKAAAAFVNFFVPKKLETKAEEYKSSKFMPFQVKSDMRLAPSNRRVLNEEEKQDLTDLLSKCDDKASYLVDLKSGKQTGKCGKTWPAEDDDVILIEEDFGESICEDKPKSKKMRAKFLMFHENKRPPYHGTWRKKSSFIKPRRPFAEDKGTFDYEVDSDDDWEEEEQGESLNGSDDEDKENEVENDDYEVDNDFFVPHGHLSDDEIDDEAAAKLSPESHKQKLKLLKDEFDEDMKTKTHKIKPRSIGCIWYNKDGSNVDEAIDRHLRPLAMITNGPIVIKKRKDLILAHNLTPTRKYAKELQKELIPAFLKLIHGNISKRTAVVDEFIKYMQNNGYIVEVSKAYLQKRMKDFAQWKKCSEEGPMFNKFCWCVEDDVKKHYNIELSLK